MIWTWKIDQEAIAAERADRFLLEAINGGLGEWSGLSGEQPELSRSRIQNLIEEGRVKVNGNLIKANSKLKQGDLIEIEVPKPTPTELIPEERQLEILYEDEHLLVINKPPGLTVHPSPTQTTGTLVHALLYSVKDLSGIGGVMRPGIVHRLDKDTSGALVVTKTDAAHTKLSEVFARHDIERAYWALCYGVPSGSRIESTIGRNPADRKKMMMNVKDGRKAATNIKVLEKYAVDDNETFASFVEARLETGRTHQVRVHLTGAGASILGDPVYGTPSNRQGKWLALPEDVREAVLKLPGQALHARVLGFEHPITGKKLRFEAEPPEAFALLAAALRRYKEGS
jgi:23S rRNA pseudouridine1911/1915/1917 synthase